MTGEEKISQSLTPRAEIESLHQTACVAKLLRSRFAEESMVKDDTNGHSFILYISSREATQTQTSSSSSLGLVFHTAANIPALAFAPF